MTDTQATEMAGGERATDLEEKIRGALKAAAADQDKELAEILANVIKQWLEDED